MTLEIDAVAALITGDPIFLCGDTSTGPTREELWAIRKAREGQGTAA